MVDKKPGKLSNMHNLHKKTSVDDFNFSISNQINCIDEAEIYDEI